MKINKLNKTLIAALLAVTITGCSNTDTPKDTSDNSKTQVASNDKITEAVEEKPTEEADKQEENTEKSDAEETKEENTDQMKAENKEENNEQPVEAPKTDDKSTENSDMKLEERDGTYYTNIMSSKDGERDSEFNSPFLANLIIDGDVLTIEGTLDYMVDPNNRDNKEEYEKGKYDFKLSPDVKLQAVGGTADPKYFTVEEFNEYYQGVKDSGLALFVEVKDGVVTVVSISS